MVAVCRWALGRHPWALTYDDVSTHYIGESTPIYPFFWWDVSSWGGYGCTIYEGDLDENLEWVRGSWVGSVHFYNYQHAAYVYLDSSLFSNFSLSQYYCTIYRTPSILDPYLRHGYTEGYWEGPDRAGNYRYHGDPGSPRFHYGHSRLTTIPPPRRTSRNTRRPPYRF